MSPSPTNSAKAAAEAVVALVQNTLDMPTIDVQGAVSDIILRHVEPIVRAVEAERDAHRNRERQGLEVVAEYLDVLENAPDELTTDGLHGLFAPGKWSDVLSERDQALAKLAEVEADRDMLRGLYRGAAADLASALTRAEQSEALLREAAETLLLDPDLCNGEHAYLADRISEHLTAKDGVPKP